MVDGTGTKSEFDDVRHGYAPAREHNRAKPPSPPRPPAQPSEEWQAEAAEDDIASSGPSSGASEPSGGRAPIMDSVHTLIDSGKAAYDAEVSLFKARADVMVSAAKRAAILIALASGAGLILLLALGFGAIIILSEYISSIAAVLIVVSVLALIAGLAAWAAQQQLDRITHAFGERHDD